MRNKKIKQQSINLYLQTSVDARAACFSNLRTQPPQSINTAPATMCLNSNCLNTAHRRVVSCSSSCPLTTQIKWQGMLPQPHHLDLRHPVLDSHQLNCASLHLVLVLLLNQLLAPVLGCPFLSPVIHVTLTQFSCSHPLINRRT